MAKVGDRTKDGETNMHGTPSPNKKSMWDTKKIGPMRLMKTKTGRAPRHQAGVQRPSMVMPQRDIDVVGIKNAQRGFWFHKQPLTNGIFVEEIPVEECPLHARTEVIMLENQVFTGRQPFKSKSISTTKKEPTRIGSTEESWMLNESKGGISH